MKGIIKKRASNIWQTIKSDVSPLIRKYYQKSYSQSGEDMILKTILCDVEEGVYVDVGANNPFVQSNTHFFYSKGWSGINIDALPGGMVQFKRHRPRDTNLDLAVSENDETLKYYMFSSSFYNSFDEKASIAHQDKLIRTVDVQTQKLSQILDQFLKGNTIDFLSVDVEGFDFAVLRSNDWERYRPKVVVYEYFVGEKQDVKETPIGSFLIKQGYVFFCNSPTNVFFVEAGFFENRFKNFLSAE